MRVTVVVGAAVVGGAAVPAQPLDPTYKFWVQWLLLLLSRQLGANSNQSRGQHMSPMRDCRELASEIDFRGSWHDIKVVRVMG